ncbi:MAG TPA: response regulator [Terriglobales bacterium]|nr:response regulator [Terriglobales bacterium]
MPRIVLLADDSVTAQNMGRRILTDAGYEVITVNNGSAALKKIHESRPDLIVLDVYMPGYGGLEVCQRLKESEATMKIPVLLTVGKMEPFKTDEAKRVRADGHIIKPFDASELLAALTKLEDRIVPQSDSGKAKSGKRTKGSVATDPAADFDSARTEQISYLKREKSRQATRDTSSDSAEKASAGVEETAEDAVTFASGPIYQSSSRKKEETAQPAPEFPVEKQADSAESSAEQYEAASDTAEAPGAQSESEAERPETVEIANSASETSSVEEVPTPTVETNSQPEAPRWVAENVALSAEEASRSLEEEMREATAAEAVAGPQDEQSPAAAVEASSKDESAPSVPESESSEGAAFAAAASASSGPVEAIASVSATGPEPASGSESAAPWQEWERIRDSVVNQQTAEAIVQSVVAEAESAIKDQTSASGAGNQPATQTAEASSSEPAKSGDALSSIVDNVLAELKPRLLAEIAKQLANDKK